MITTMSNLEGSRPYSTAMQPNAPGVLDAKKKRATHFSDISMLAKMHEISQNVFAGAQEINLDVDHSRKALEHYANQKE